MLRTLYLQRRLSINGRSALGGRSLYDRFKQRSTDTLLGHIVYDDDDFAKVTDPNVKMDIVSRSMLTELRPNVVFVEGGLFANREGTWKIPQDMAAAICESGGVVIVADVDHNELHQLKQLYRSAGPFFDAFASYGPENSDHPVYGSDESRFWKGYRQILCKPEHMILSEWLRPIYNGIPEVLVGLPIRLSSWDSLVASCNSDTTGTLHLDQWVDHQDACPFASAHQIGSGFAVLIAGLVSGDAWLEGCRHNPVWLTNLAEFLVAEAEGEQERRRSHHRSPHLLFLSHRSTDKKLVSTVAAAIKKGGVRIWLDQEQLVPSQSLTQEISRALGTMTHFVLFWSANCLGAPWVERELASATALLVEKRVPLVIVRLDETPVPSIVADLFRIEGLGRDPTEIGRQLVEAIERLSLRRTQ